jgi:VWFA-related protein
MMGVNFFPKKVTIVLIFGLVLVGFSPWQVDSPDAKTANVQITQVDTSQFPEVTVYVSVTDENGEPVGVAPQEIRLMENDQAISPDHFSGMGEVSDLTTLLVIDISGSMNSGGKLVAAKAAAVAYVEKMRPGDRAGLMTFNTRIDLVQAVTRDTAALIAAIEGLQAKEDTMMYDALVEAVKHLESFTGRKAMIVLTDGLDNRSAHTAQDVIDRIGPAGLSISTIGLGDPTHGKGAQTALDEQALTRMAESAGGVYGYAADEESLMNLYELYGRALQAEYQVTYTSPSAVRDGVNRSLAVFIDSMPENAGTEVYNPGGLVPETGQPPSWLLFLALFAGLLALLLLPTVLQVGKRLVQKRGEGPLPAKVARIKLKD